MTPKAGPIFSEAALSRLDCDEPIAANDPGTGINLIYRPAEATLTLFGGLLGHHVLVVPCREAQIETTARQHLRRLGAGPK